MPVYIHSDWLGFADDFTKGKSSSALSKNEHCKGKCAVLMPIFGVDCLLRIIVQQRISHVHSKPYEMPRKGKNECFVLKLLIVHGLV